MKICGIYMHTNFVVGKSSKMIVMVMKNVVPYKSVMRYDLKGFNSDKRNVRSKHTF